MLKLENMIVRQDLTEEELREKALRRYGIGEDEVLGFQIARKSIDARDKKDVHYLYSFYVEVKDEERYPALPKAVAAPPQSAVKVRKSSYAPVIVGTGPAGLFCALTLIENGYRPILLERGDDVAQRMRQLQAYRAGGPLDPESNVQFGEGGAGTFSDGKLTTGIHSAHIRWVLEQFVRFGGPPDILYLNHPHIGTDRLQGILAAMRQYIERRGGQYHFRTKMTDLIPQPDGTMKVVCGDRAFLSDAVVLALGHSARDSLAMLQRRGYPLKRKNFAVGVRVEHLQAMINASQYGTATRLKLPPAEYKLVYHDGLRTCYSFCMCPGGEVIASGSEADGIVTNGMSNYARDGVNANGALLVNVTAADLPGEDPLEGARWQRRLEQQAFRAAGGSGLAPAQRYDDFAAGRLSRQWGRVMPTYRPGTAFADLNAVLPPFVSTTLKNGMTYFDHRIAGFASGDTVLTGVESRTSSPVTVLRDQHGKAAGLPVYPCGEGAGYAGGITSAAVDGIQTAFHIMEER
jgi:uncharacterized FAD-dependent dehydrogenase